MVQTGSFTRSSTSPQRESMPTHRPLSSATVNLPPADSNPATPGIPPFPSHLGMVGNPITPGAPGVLPQGSFPSSVADWTIPPLMQLPTTIPPYSVYQQRQDYPPEWVRPHPQAQWPHPSQMIGMQRPPYLSYPAMVTNPSLVGSQLPGVSPEEGSGVTLSTSLRSVQYVSVSETQPEITPPGTEHGKKTNQVPANNGEVNAWTAHKSAAGAVFYYNAVTGVLTHERPHGFEGEADKVIAQSTAVLGYKIPDISPIYHVSFSWRYDFSLYPLTYRFSDISL